MKTLTFKGTEEQIEEVLQPLSLLSIKEAVFLKTAIRSNLNNLLIDDALMFDSLREQYKEVQYGSNDDRLLRRRQYLSVKCFCIDCNLLSFEVIEAMEKEVNGK
jgi:hypothetical protein